MHEPLSWYPDEDGRFGAVWSDRRDRHEFVIEPQLARTFSESKGDYTDEPWLAWTVRWNGSG